MRFKKTLALAGLLMIAAGNMAQQKEDIHVITQSKKDGIWLRWAPASATTWMLGNKYGYKVERFTITDSGELEDTAGANLTGHALKPYTAEELERLSASIPEAAVLRQLLYNEPSGQPATKSNGILAQNADVSNKYGVALLICDLHRPLAQAAALFMEDTDVVQGKKYIYRISITTPSKIVQPGVIVTSFTKQTPLPQHKDLKVQFADRKVTLSWPVLLDRGIYSAYYIERSINGQDFTRLSDLPYVHMSESVDNTTTYYVDSLNNNTDSITYRIQGVTPFGETGPYSTTIGGKGIDDVKGYLIIRDGKLHNQQVSLYWDFPPQAEKQIAEFRLSYSNSADGPWLEQKESVAPDKRTTQTPMPFQNCYFIITALDNVGNAKARSFPYFIHAEDSIPPQTPSGIIGAISNAGAVSIKWDQVPDRDLLGYRVFKTNSVDQEFVEVTKSIISSSSFIDSVTLKTLNRDVFYRVVAVDKNYNTSAYSQPLKITKPDIIPPVAALFTSVELKNDAISVSWNNSTSEDIHKNLLYRRSAQDTSLTLITTWISNQVSEFADTSGQLGNTYQYTIHSYDSSGNKATAYSGQLFFETGMRRPATDLSTAVSHEERKITLQWKNPVPPIKCIVYRKINNTHFSIYSTLEGNTVQFTDKAVAVSNTYSYKIQLIYSKGVKSMLSEASTVNY